MSKFLSLLLLLVLAAPSGVLAQDFHKGGFFDSEVSQTGFFSDDQAGIPIKNNTGATTTRSKKDSWEVPPEKLAAIVTEEAKIASDERIKKDETNGGDSFEVNNGPKD